MSENLIREFHNKIGIEVVYEKKEISQILEQKIVEEFLIEKI